MTATVKWAVDAKASGNGSRAQTAGGWRCWSALTSRRSKASRFNKVVSSNYVAVVCEREENAIKKQPSSLRSEWQKPATMPFPTSENLFKYMREATPTSVTKSRTGASDAIGDPMVRWRLVAKVIEAEYEVPFQGHTSIGPAHAMADPSNGQMTIWSNDMKAYGLRTGVAEFLGMPRDQVRVIWQDGPQLYGRTAADDAGFEAAFLAKELGRPVRIQWMRNEETAWDVKGPAFTFKLRGGLDAQGNLVALDYYARTVDYNPIGYNEPDTVLIAQLMGRRPKAPASGGATPPEEMYFIPNRRGTTDVVALPLVWETPLRVGNLRDPNGPQATFAGESFTDELAAAAKADPVEFRLRLLAASTEDDHAFKRARSIAGLKQRLRLGGFGQPSLTKANHCSRPHPHRARHFILLPRPNGCRDDR